MYMLYKPRNWSRHMMGHDVFVIFKIITVYHVSWRPITVVVIKYLLITGRWPCIFIRTSDDTRTRAWAPETRTAIISTCTMRTAYNTHSTIAMLSNLCIEIEKSDTYAYTHYWPIEMEANENDALRGIHIIHSELTSIKGVTIAVHTLYF